MKKSFIGKVSAFGRGRRQIPEMKLSCKMLESLQIGAKPTGITDVPKLEHCHNSSNTEKCFHLQIAA